MDRRGQLFGLFNRFLEGKIDHKPIEEFVNRECAREVREFAEKVRPPKYEFGFNELADKINAKIDEELERYK